ncbi:O-antigen ligase family protein [Acidobacteria bacterium AH-259-D05]|nr:O-antigen ligase family protein [Acidobacteria bacterium AH-259-D05]
MARVLGTNPFAAFLMVLMVGFLCLSALAISQVETNVAVLLSLGMVVSILAFFNTRMAIYLLIFSMLLSPEFAVSGLATSGAALGRGVTFRFDDFLLVIIAVAWLVKSALYKELGIFRKTPLNGAMLFYVLACAVSTLIGIGAVRVQFVTGTLFVLKYVQYFILFFLVINNIEDEKQLRRYWLAILLTALIASAIGLSQIPTGGRVTAPFEGSQPEPNTFGGYLGFLILICLALSLALQDYGRRIGYALVALFLLLPFLFTLSRASYLGLVPGLAVVLLLNRSHLLSYCLMALTLSLLIFPQIFPQIIRERVTYTWSQERRSGQVLLFGQRLDTSTSARLQSFRDALRDFPEEPLFGYGVTGWHFIDAQYFRTLLETGLFGLTALLFLFYKVFQLGLDRLRYFAEDPFYKGLSIGFLGGFVCLLFHAIGSNTFIIVRIMQPFWLVTGILFMSRLVATRKSPEEDAEPLAEAA